MTMRVGIGFDIHRLVKGRPLILGAVKIPSPKGALAHSDGDALLHALCDALLGAMGERDMGTYFPDKDPEYQNAPSSLFIRETMKKVRAKKLCVLNADAVIVIEKPKLQPFIDAIRREISKLLSTKNVSVKAKTHEKLGDIGRGNAVSCMAVVCLGKNASRKA